MRERLKRLLAQLANPDASAVRILCCGALGGLLATLRVAVEGTSETAWYLALLRDVSMGAGAAFVAIYVLLGTNTQELLRSSGVALLAGHFWLPIFDAGREYVLAEPERAAERAVSAEAGKLDDAAEALERSGSDAALLLQTGRLADTLTERVAELRSGPLKSRAVSAITRSLDVIAAKAGKDDTIALGLLESVGETATRTANPRVLERTSAVIGKLPASPGSALEARKKELKARFPPLR